MNGQEVGTFLRNAAVAKVSAAPMELFAKAIFCNICVCLAVWCSIKNENRDWQDHDGDLGCDDLCYQRDMSTALPI